MVFYLVMCILWFIVMIIQAVIALIAWLVWRLLRAIVEENCRQIGDTCHCDSNEKEPIKGELNDILARRQGSFFLP